MKREQIRKESIARLKLDLSGNAYLKPKSESKILILAERVAIWYAVLSFIILLIACLT